MEKNKVSKLVAVVLLLVMIALVLVSGTYAKYTSTASGSDSARVAKWSFTVGKTDIADSESFAFNLFETINDTDGKTVETDVVSANGDKVIAPGTSGSFDIELTNASEVTAQYGINFTVTNTNNIPVKFSIDGVECDEGLDNISASDTTKLAPKAKKTITVQWKWDYSGDDVTDTGLGKDGTATLAVKADVTATQVD